MVLCLGTAVLLAALFFRSRIWTQSELTDWCREQTAASLLREHANPTQWTPLLYSEPGEDGLEIVGQWRIGLKDVQVQCNAKWGRKRNQASYEIQDWK